MKKCAYLVLLVFTLLVSCSLEDDPNNDFYLEFMPVEDIIMPEEFVHGETYSIGVSYIKPNSCYQFNNFAYDIDGHERTIAVVNTVYTGSSANCVGEPVLNTVSFDFTVTGTDTYIFKFFQGEDETGTDQYYIIEIPVVDGRSAPAGSKN
ncbi:hypothetical protein [Winogradskyella pulchriflava]|uniref:Lipoprotein n=1 Tax=Winogradskyella pulchriflava TaxID=1110688 RepID=A0ABV6Q554_9FLAO